MANSIDATKRDMLATIGAPSIEALFEQIPVDHRMTGALHLPPPLRSEVELRRHILSLLKKNSDCESSLSFLGGGCWRHHVPAICDEIAGRSEFLTPVWGTPSSDHGRNQAWFEFTSQLGELLDMEIVGLPVYSWGCAAGHAIRMASRLTGRNEVLVPRIIDPERLSVIRNYCEPIEMPNHIAVIEVDFDPATGLIDLADLEAKISHRTAGVYLETPNYLGIIETQGYEIAAIAHQAGAEVIVGVDPISLGVLAPPSNWGADIVVGTTQTLGVHMQCGGGTGGFIASRDEERYAREYPCLLVSIAETTVPGERAFGLSLLNQSSYGMRENGKDWTGNSVYLWAISNAVYMSAMGPQGFRDVGELILQQSHYAAKRLAGIAGVEVLFSSGFFKEFVVRFDGTGKTVEAINRALRERGVFGGHDLSVDFPGLGQAALYAVTEIHSKGDIDRLVECLLEVVR